MKHDLPKHSLGYLTGSISQALSDRLRQNFLNHGLDMPHAQFVLLLDLFEQDGQTQQSLANKVFKDKAAIKRTVDNLIAKGLVTRCDQSAGRNTPIRLSPKAYQLETLMRQVAEQTIIEATQGISTDELNHCLFVLRKLQLQLEIQTQTDSRKS